MSRKVTMWVSIILLICFLGAFVFSFLSGFSAYADTLQNQIDEATQKKEDIQDDLNEVQQEKKSVLAEKNELETKIDSIQNEIDAIQQEINQCQGRIDQKTIELQQAEQDAQDQYDTMKIRLRTMYEDNSTSYISLIFGGENITDVLGYIEIIKQLVSYDNNMYTELTETKNTIEQAKIELEQEQALSVSKKEEQVAKQNELSAQEEELTKTIDKLTSDEEAYKKAYEEAEAAENSLKAQLYSSMTNTGPTSSGVTYSGDGLVWPTPGYTAITCPYGMRMHPTLHVYKMHTGVDIGAPYGATVVATAAGTVTSAGWNNAYGWYVVINHGGGMTSLYGHHSKLLVSAGQHVNAGDPIGKVGSTGFSTGPHSHFEVLQNGQTVNPMSFF